MRVQLWTNVVMCNVVTYNEHVKSNLTMDETLLEKGILEKLTKERKNLVFYTTANKLKP